jgi:folate-dependent phosphoribosylglycinamide formyltransferase PurN
MSYQLIYKPSLEKKMRVACFISGSGTNAVKIITESRKSESNYEVVLIFTDVRDDRKKKNGSKLCKALDIAEKFGIPYACEDIRDFYKSKGHKNRRDLSIRPEFDKRVIAKIEPYKLDIIANAGYMSIMTIPILDRYHGKIVNVHPADLSKTDGEDRKYVGIHVVEEAIMAGEKEIRATTHIVRKKVDYGEILVISKPVQIELPEHVNIETLKMDKKLRKNLVSQHQSVLKEKGDWVIYPITLQMISEGLFGLNGKGGVFYRGKLLSQGLKL